MVNPEWSFELCYSEGLFIFGGFMKKLLVAAAFVSSVSFAAGSKADSFKSLDKDGDGQVTAEEAAGDAAVNSHFSTLDKNSDGKISAEEFKAHADDHGKKGHEKKAK